MAFADLSLDFSNMMQYGDEPSSLSREVALDIEAMRSYFDRVEMTKTILHNLCTIGNQDHLFYEDEFVLLGTMVSQLVENKDLVNLVWFKKYHMYLTQTLPICVKTALSKYAHEAIMIGGYLNDHEVRVIYNANKSILEGLQKLGIGMLDIV